MRSSSTGTRRPSAIPLSFQPPPSSTSHPRHECRCWIVRATMRSAFATARLSTSSSILLLLSLCGLPLVSAFSFTIDNTPQQCANLSLSITGSDGTPPYNALILPFGGSPLPNSTEARRIIAQSFGSGTSTSFKLNYPSDSQFIVVVRYNYISNKPRLIEFALLGERQ